MFDTIPAVQYVRRHFEMVCNYPFTAALLADMPLGRIRGRVEFGTKCLISPLSRISSPERCQFGNQTVVGPWTALKPGHPDGRITLGNDCTLHEFGFVAGDVAIGDDTRIAQKVSIHSFDHSIDPDMPVREQPLDMGHVEIGEDVWIGAAVSILKDVTVGDGAVVASGAVVIDDVAPETIVAGVPAERVGVRE